MLLLAFSDDKTEAGKEQLIEKKSLAGYILCLTHVISASILSMNQQTEDSTLKLISAD